MPIMSFGPRRGIGTLQGSGNEPVAFTSDGPTNATPYAFDVVDVRSWDITGDQEYLLSSLEGIVNHDAARLFVIRSDENNGWLSSIADDAYTTSTLAVSNLSGLLAYYDSYIDGVVIFDEQNESANVATPLCGIYHAVMVSRALAPMALAWSALSDEPVVANITALYSAHGFNSSTLKGTIYQWAFDTWFASCNQTALAMFDYFYPSHIRSLLAGNSIFTLWQPAYVPANERDTPEDFASFEYILDNSPQDMIVYGYMFPDGGNEHEVVSRLSARGKYLVPSDWFTNAPFYQHLPLPANYTFLQKARAETASIPLENKVYIAGIYSDGDNVQYVENHMRWNLWESTAHKTSPVPCSWELSPSILRIAPPIARFYYDNATPNDYFVTGVGGKGYAKANYMTREYFDVFWSTTRALMARLDEREVRSWTGSFGNIIAAMNNVPGSPAQCDGVYEGYGGGDYKAPEAVAGVPVVYMRGFTAPSSSDLQRYYDEIETLRSRPRSTPVFVCFHLMCWESPYDRWAEFVNTLEATGDVAAVTAGQLSSLISRSAAGAITAVTMALVVAGIWGVPVLIFLAGAIPRARKKRSEVPQ